MSDLTTAPLVPGDAEEVAHVWRTCDLHDAGEAIASADDFVALCKQPSMDLGRHTIGVRDGGALVAAGMLLGESTAFVHVLPAHRGRGIGSRLLRWSEEAGLAAGHTRSRQTLWENEHAGRALLEAAGYERSWEEWIFDIELEREPDSPRLPPGYAIRDFAPGRDERDCHRVIEEAFGEWPEAEATAFEDWAAATLGRPGFLPAHIGTIVQREQIVGVAVNIEDDGYWVHQLAVHREHRGRGLARALLMHAFAAAWRSGHRHCGLSTDSRTGARGLYEHVGMHVTRTSWEYAKLL